MSEKYTKQSIVIKGHKMPPFVTEETLKFATNYKPSNEDIFIVSYPKCGTTWAQSIIYLIDNNGVPVEKSIHRLSYLEFFGKNAILKPVIKTHLPFDLLPMNTSVKNIFVLRNPKDVVVSQYYFIKKHPLIAMNYDFHQFLNEWINGEIGYGDYFAHTRDYWTHRFDGNYLYLIYEQMVDNPKEAVLKIANYLGKESMDKLMANNEMILNKVLKNSSFDNMKVNANFVRKGIVGDWRSHLTRDESDLIDEKFEEYFAGTELESIWKDVMKWV